MTSPPKSPTSGRKWASWISRSGSRSEDLEIPTIIIDKSNFIDDFTSQMPSAAEASIRPKETVLDELSQRISKLKNEYMKHLEAAKVKATAANNEQLCVELENSMRDILASYIRPIEEVATEMAKVKAAEVFPRGPGDIGIALPAISKVTLERAINAKRNAVFKEINTTTGSFHSSWVEKQMISDLNEDLDNWAADVREISNDVASKWMRWIGIAVAVLIPLLVSMMLFSAHSCKAGYYYSKTPSYWSSQSSDMSSSPLSVGGTDIRTSSSGASHCTPCPPGSYSHAGASSCILCDINSYASKPKSTFCHVCPAGSVARQKGAVSCDCLEGYKAIAERKDDSTSIMCYLPEELLDVKAGKKKVQNGELKQQRGATSNNDAKKDGEMKEVVAAGATAVPKAVSKNVDRDLRMVNVEIEANDEERVLTETAADGGGRRSKDEIAIIISTYR